MYYHLMKPWRLCGFGHDLLLLDSAEPGWPVYHLTPALFRLLERCNGQFDWDKTAATDAECAVLTRYENMRIIERSDIPRPIEAWQDYVHFDNRRIIAAQWAITGVCNMRCRHCFATADNRETRSVVTPQQARHTARQLAGCGVHSIWLTGGEPLTNPDFEQILRIIAEAGLNVTRLFTNGLLLRPGTLTHFRELGMCPEVVISFDGLGRHNWMRGVPGAEKAALDAIRLALREGNGVCVAMNLNAATVDTAADTAAFLFELGVRRLFFIRTTEVPVWLASGGISLTYEAFCENVVQLARALRPLNLRGLDIRFYNCCQLTPKMDAERMERSFHMYHSDEAPVSAWCQKAIDTPFISSDGYVLPCDGFEGAAIAGEQTHWGNNLFERPLCDILNDSRYADIMKLRAQDVMDASAECRECAYAERCSGGVCRACAVVKSAMQQGGDFSCMLEAVRGQSPLTCTFYRGGYYERIVQMLREKP